MRALADVDAICFLPSGMNAKVKKFKKWRVNGGSNYDLKEGVETMIRLGKSLHEHPRIAKQMTGHLPGQAVKQIRDKRREPPYKALVEVYMTSQGHSVTPKPPENMSSDTESDTAIQMESTTKIQSRIEPAADNGSSISEDETNEQRLQATEMLNSALEPGDTQGTYDEATEIPNSPIGTGHTQGSYDEIHKWQPHITRPVGRPKHRWEDDVRNDLKKMKLLKWTEQAQDRHEWKKIVGKAKTLHEL